VTVVATYREADIPVLIRDLLITGGVGRRADVWLDGLQKGPRVPYPLTLLGQI